MTAAYQPLAIEGLADQICGLLNKAKERMPQRTDNIAEEADLLGSNSGLFELMISKSDSFTSGSPSLQLLRDEEVIDVVDMDGRSWVISLSDPIGRGSFGTIHPAKKVETVLVGDSPGATRLVDGFAAKLIPLSKFVANHQQARAVAREVVTWQMACNPADRHPNIVIIYAAGLIEAPPHSASVLGGPTLFLILQCVRGGTLRSISIHERQDSVFTTTVFKMALVGIASALAHLHRKGIVHGDVKPGNVLINLEGAGDFMLADFGAAHFLDSVMDAHNENEELLPWGTPCFISPEQSCSRVRRSSDVWSLAITVFSVLIGRTPYPSGMLPDVIVGLFRRQLLGASLVSPDQSLLSGNSGSSSSVDSFALKDFWPNVDPILTETWCTADEPTAEMRRSVHDMLLRCTCAAEHQRPTAEELMAIAASL
jgi:serine/threonine protein kinase